MAKSISRNSAKAAKLRKIESNKFTEAQEALMEAVIDAVGEDAGFPEFEEALLGMSNELVRRVTKKNSEK